MDNGARVVLAVIGSIVTLAFVSAVLSPKATTVQVTQAASNGLATLISAATAPITGQSGSYSSGSGSSLLNGFNSVLPNIGGLLGGGSGGGGVLNF